MCRLPKLIEHALKARHHGHDLRQGWFRARGPVYSFIVTSSPKQHRVQAHAVGPYLISWRTRLARQSQRAERRRQQAMKVASALANYLGKRYSIRRAAVMGSMLRPGDFRLDSDIDLVVWGLPKSALISAWVELEKRSSFPIDLVAWEMATPRLRRASLHHGWVIYRAGAD